MKLCFLNLKVLLVQVIFVGNSIEDVQTFNETVHPFIRRLRDKTRTTPPRIVLVLESPLYEENPYNIGSCKDWNEIWSNKCELYCLHQGDWIDSDQYEDRRCKRSVSEFFADHHLYEESLDSSSSSRLERKKKKKNKTEMLMVMLEKEKETMISVPKTHQCVCKRNFARLDGRCVPLGRCPGNYHTF